MANSPLALLTSTVYPPGSSGEARDTPVTLLLRHGDITRYVSTGKLPRPDVAAHYATPPAWVSGGAHGLDGADSAGEILHDSRPAAGEWEIALRPECGTRVCTASTEQRLLR